MLRTLWYMFILLIGKTIHFILRALHYQATTLPGKIVVYLCPSIFRHLTKNISLILITGTNGKTTVTRMLAHILRENDISCISNLSGANMRYGIATTLFTACSISGKYQDKYAVLECDEGDFHKISKYITSTNVTVLVTNLFEDQLDRFGSLDRIRGYHLRALESLPQAHICLNADCPLTASLAETLPNPITYYGLSASTTQRFSTKEANPFCPECGHSLEYRSHTYGHLGDYFCPACQFQRPAPTLTLSIARENEITLHTPGSQFSYQTAYPTHATYRLYNSLSAASVLHHLNLAVFTEECFQLNYANPGRQETLTVGNNTFTLILAKNPAGYQQVLEELVSTQTESELIFALNNALSDGKDISWTRNIDFSPLAEYLPPETQVYFCGSHAADMADCLKHAGLNPDRFVIEPDFAKLYDKIHPYKKHYTVFYTYSNMTYIRNTLLSQAESFSPKT